MPVELGDDSEVRLSGVRNGVIASLIYATLAIGMAIWASTAAGGLQVGLAVVALVFFLVAVWCGLIWGGLRLLLGKYSPRLDTESREECRDSIHPISSERTGFQRSNGAIGRDHLRRGSSESMPPKIASYADAVAWAQAHPVVPDGANARMLSKDCIDRQLPPEALAVVVDLLASDDVELVGPALFALTANGALIESDADIDSDPTFYSVTLPDGSVHFRRTG